MFRIAMAVLIFATMAFGAARADDAPSGEASQTARAAAVKAAWEAANKAATFGPAEIKLLDQATLKLTDDEAFVPTAEANQIMKAYGNAVGPGRVGLIVSKGAGDWLIDVTWTGDGFVRDGDAKEWRADTMLQNLREGTDSHNPERVAMGLPELDVVGWVEPPAYDGATHRLVWSLGLRNRGAADSESPTVNYNTYALGRSGYFSLDLICSSKVIDADKPIVRGLLQTLVYNPTQRYEDFSESTDKVAEYGLAALVGAVAVKKLGLLAVAGVFLLKIWKLGLIAVVGAGAAFRRLFKRTGSPAES